MSILLHWGKAAREKWGIFKVRHHVLSGPPKLFPCNPPPKKDLHYTSMRRGADAHMLQRGAVRGQTGVVHSLVTAPRRIKHRRTRTEHMMDKNGRTSMTWQNTQQLLDLIHPHDFTRQWHTIWPLIRPLTSKSHPLSHQSVVCLFHSFWEHVVLKLFSVSLKQSWLSRWRCWWCGRDTNLCGRVDDCQIVAIEHGAAKGGQESHRQQRLCKMLKKRWRRENN